MRQVAAVEAFGTFFAPHVVQARQVVAVASMKHTCFVRALSFHSTLSGQEGISQRVKDATLDQDVTQSGGAQELIVGESDQPEDGDDTRHAV